MGTKNNPSKYDCYANAEPDEPMFVLLARDPHAPEAVERWAADRSYFVDRGWKPTGDRRLVEEALECARAMRAWRRDNRPSPPPGKEADRP